MIDSHIHSKVSSDSKMEIEKAIEKAKKMNIGLAITEHMDYKYPTENMFTFDVDNYFDSYSKYRGNNIFLGVEMGMRTDCIKENMELANKYDFDFIIGSIHVVNKIDIYQEHFYEGKTKKEAYEEYLKYMLECVQTYNCFDTLGHIDYISRYAKVDDREIYYEEFSDYIDAVLREIVNKEKAIEINTRRLHDPKAVENLFNIYRRYRELGGCYVTIGSDSHNADDIGNNFNIAKEIVDYFKLKPVYFKNRKMDYQSY